MTTRTSLAAVALVLALGATGSFAQQLEANDATGSLQSNGVDPTPGSPFIINVTDTINLDAGGTPGLGFALLSGQLATTSLATGINGQFFDLNLAMPIAVLGDGLGGGGGGLPAAFFFLNALGNANFSFPVNTALLNQSFAFQAIVADPTQGVFPFNFTAAPRVLVQALVVLLGDDTRVSYTFPSGPYPAYGSLFASIDVSSNGYIKFGTATASDFTESTAEFLGIVGGGAAGPIVAPLWEDIDVGNGVPGQMCTINETSPGITTVSWVNADYFPATPFGTVSCTLNATSGVLNFTFDYTGYTLLAPPTEGIIGISDGGTVGATVAAHEMAVGGAVNFFAGSGVSDTVFQNFDGTGVPALPAEPFDLAGLVLNFIDISGTGSYTIF